MSGIEIKKNVPRPDWARPRVGAGRKSHYDFDSIEVGGLMVIPVEDQKSSNFHTFKVMLANFRKRRGRKLFARKREDGAFEVYREA